MNEQAIVALRVLTCMQRRNAVSRTDLESLQMWVAPGDRNAEPIELACIVITAELMRRTDSAERAEPAKA